jgi:YidC/Oxa1 family membrane protein insertase
VNDFTAIWNTALVWPIEGALRGLTEISGQAGIAIILFTIVVRTIMLPLSLQQIRSQKAMMALQPELKDLQQKYAGDRAKISQEQLRLYRERGVNPVAGCLPLVIQMPIWLALYSALINLSTGEHRIDAFQAGFLWIPSLAHPPALSAQDPWTWPQLILPVLTMVSQWVVQRMSVLPSADPQQQQMNRMMEFMPLMFMVFAFQVAAGLTLYWVVSNLYSIAQQRFTVGWGTLPFLGSPGPGRGSASPSKDDNSDSTSARSGPRPQRRRTSTPGRRRKGK